MRGIMTTLTVGDFSPALAEKIEKARQEHREGKGVVLKTREDIEKWFDAL